MKGKRKKDNKEKREKYFGIFNLSRFLIFTLTK
jgi:hypothetical protein